MNKYTKKTSAEGTQPARRPQPRAPQGTPGRRGPRTAGGEAEQGAAESRRGPGPAHAAGVTLLLHTRRDPEHLRQTTQHGQGWDSGRRHKPGTRVHVCPPTPPRSESVRL